MARTPSYLVLDIETVPDLERWTPPDPAQNVHAFPPSWAHRIVVLGCLALDHGYNVIRHGVIGAQDETGLGSADARERFLLRELSHLVGDAKPVLVTFNGRSFDLPVIALRSLCHGVPLPWYYRDHNVRYRYTDQGHLDLCDWLADHGATRSSSLDALARLIGLPGKVGIDGSKVEQLYRDGGLAQIEQYCLGDVAQTALLFLRFRLLQGQLDAEDYRAKTSALLEATRLDGVDTARLLDV